MKELVNTLSLAVLLFCLCIPLAGLFGAITGILNIDESSALFGFFIHNAVAFGPIMLASFSTWASTNS